MSNDRGPIWSRRRVVGAVAMAGAGLGVGIWLRRRHRVPIPSEPRSATAFSPDAFLRIDTSGTITLVTGATEMGQGIHTALGLIVAEALDAEWRCIRVENAVENVAYYNPWMGAQRTAASSSIQVWWRPVQEAAGRARAMLLEAAAIEWSAPVRQCHTDHGSVVHVKSGRRLEYGELAPRAGMLNPQEFASRPAANGRFVGRGAQCLSAADIVTGRLQFGADIRVPGLVYASMCRSPQAGARLLCFNEGAARKINGVLDVHRTNEGLGVIGSDSWAALRGRRALEPRWEALPGAGPDDATVRARYEAALTSPGEIVARRGTENPQRRAGLPVLEARYWIPLLAHAAMEPGNCTALVTADTCSIWLPTQDQSAARAAAERVSGLPRSSVTVHTTAVGGGFGGRVSSVVVEEAVSLARGIGRPVQLLWTRPDDFQRDQYHPCSAHWIRVLPGLDTPVEAWDHRIVGGGGEGAIPPYAVASLTVSRQAADPGVQTGIWRGVDHVANAFVVETMMDELATARNTDPLELRMQLLRPRSREAGVLRMLSVAGAWPAGNSKAAGLAVHSMCNSAIAAVAEVEFDPEGLPRASRVTCAVDCGTVVNPDGIRAQIEGGVAFGLSAALQGGVSVAGGAVTGGNFDSYRPLAIGEMPEVRVLIASGKRDPGGIGEIAVPVAIPALANALFRLTGSRERSLPFTALPPRARPGT